MAILPLLLLFSSISKGHNHPRDTTFFDENWKKCNKKNWVYCRLSTYDSLTKTYLVEDFFRSGKLQMTGQFLNLRKEKKTGDFVWYYENGQVQSKSSYINDKGDGPTIAWFENGEVNYTGYFTKGKSEGKWTYYHKEEPRKSAEIMYKKNKIILEKYWNLDGREHSDNSQANQFPRHPDGDLFAFIFKLSQTTKYPQSLLEKQIEGTVKLRFVVDYTGKIAEITIQSSGNKELDNEALRAFESLKTKWIPGKKFNRNENYCFIIPIAFKYKNEY